MEKIAEFLSSTVPMVIADFSALVALVWTIVQHYTKAKK
nr:MAG: hypothetical protein [Microvirus sp.]